MLNKPKFMSPSINMYGNSVIDRNSNSIPFSCIVDGNEAVTHFRIIITRLKDNASVYDSGEIALDKPFLPIDNRNKNVVFSINLKDYFNNSMSNFVNSKDAYCWTITLKNSTSGTETCSAAEVFYANSVPATTIYYDYNNESFNSALSTDETNKTKIEKRKAYFKAIYSQAESIPLKRYGWRLTDTTNNVIIMDTISQNQIYGVAEDISCVCNGLMNGASYLLELYIETQNGYFGILQSAKFDVGYEVKSIDADFGVEALNDTAGIMLNWGNLRTTEGVVVGDPVSYTENFPIENSVSIEIPEDTSIVFSDNANGKGLGIDESSYVVLSFWFNKTQDATLLDMSGFDENSNVIARKLTYTASDRKLKYTISKGDTVSSYSQQLSATISELCWYVITLYPLSNGSAGFKLVESVAENGLFPNEDLYPEEDLYPDFGEWDALR